MSGHSKWSTIKHAKAVTDSRRGKLFTKIAREIIACVRQSGPSSDSNFRLRLAIQKARDNNMPMDRVDRAIDRGAGVGKEAETFDEMNYEGYGPGGIAILLQSLTDNKNRTVADIRSTFTKGGGNLAEAGSVAWQFNSRGLLLVSADNIDSDEISLLAIDAGAEDIEEDEGVMNIYCLPENLEIIRKKLVDIGVEIKSSELIMFPSNTIDLDSKTAMSVLRLLDKLEELDDVQKVFSNANFSDDILNGYSNNTES